MSPRATGMWKAIRGLPDGTISCRGCRTRVPRKHLGAVASGLGLVGVTVAIGWVLAANRPPGPFERPEPPAPVGAFRDGGTPDRDDAIETALRQLPGSIPARDHPAFASRPGISAAWRGLADAFASWPTLSPTDRRLDERSRELRAHVSHVSDRLAAAGLGYHLDLQIPIVEAIARPELHAYRIDEVTFVRADRERIRVLGVRRLDPVRLTMLGRTSEELDDPVVLLDQVDAKVDEQILPVLGGYAFPIGDNAWSRSSQGRQVAAIAGAAIRRELHAALGTDADPVPRCTRLVVASVRHHEAQHVIDQRRMLAYPKSLAGYLKEPAEAAFAIRTRYELSAYLSQIASDMWLPQLVLWNLSRHAFRQQETRVPEAYAAVVAIESLANRLGIRVPGSLMSHGVVDRDRLAALVEPLSKVPTIELRTAAAAVWNELFERKLVRLVDDARLR